MVNEKKDLNNKYDKKISIAIMASFVILTIQYLILIYFNLLESSKGLFIQLLSKGLVGMVYLYALPAILKRSSIKFIGTYFIATFVFLLHFVIFPDNRGFIVGILFPFFFMCLPSFVYTLSIRDFSILKDIMKKCSYIVFLVGLMIGILVFSGNASVGTYSMSLSYYMLLPTIFFIDELIDKFLKKNLIFIFLSVMIILSLGSRGAILCIIVFIILKFLRTNLKLTNKRALAFFILLSIGVVILLFLDQVIMFIYNMLLHVGVRSRTLLLFLQDGVHLSGRDIIYRGVMAEIIESPWLGIGIAGDRRVLSGGYTHNFFIELIGNFGFILGILVSVGIIILIIKALIIKDRDKYNLIIIWMSLGFVHLMVSGSYLTDINFWIFLGLMISIKKSGKVGNYYKGELNS